MNTERPDNDEASGGGDGSAAEAHGADGARGAEKQPGSGAPAPVDAETQSRSGADPVGEAESGGTREASGAAGGSEDRSEDVTDGGPKGVTDDGPDDVTGGDSGASSADDDTPAAPSPTSLDKPTAAEATAHDASTGPDSEAEGPAGLPEPTAADSEIPRDEETGAHHPGRFRSPVAIAAVAAAVLLVGGGGAYFAASTSGGSGGSGGGTTSGAAGDETPPQLALDGYGGGDGSGGAGNGIAPGEPNPYGATYRVDGSLPKGPGSAPVYRVQGQVTEDDVTRLAEALGLSGTPVAQGQVWRVGAKDGSGPSLRVNRQAPGAWTFQRYSPVIDNCDSATVCGAKPGATTDAPVSAAAAEKAAAPVLKAVGQGGAELDASQVMGAQRVVNADPLVGGLPTYGWATGVTVNAQGEVVGGTGQLTAPVKSDTYPVLSAEKTLGLLNRVPVTDHRMGIGGCASPVPLKDRLEAPCGQSTASPSGSTLAVEKAVFGLASHFVGGRQALVPSWLFEVRQAGAQKSFTVTYPAVDPRYIASPATATPSPTAPSDAPSSAPKTRDVKIDGYTAEGDELTVSFTGGVCADYTAAASERSGEVRVEVTAKPWPDKVCIMIAKEIQKTVSLDEPLGDRKVVGSDGKQLPLQKAGARLPETSGAR